MSSGRHRKKERQHSGFPIGPPTLVLAERPGAYLGKSDGMPSLIQPKTVDENMDNVP